MGCPYYTTKESAPSIVGVALAATLALAGALERYMRLRGSFISSIKIRYRWRTHGDLDEGNDIG